MLSKNEIKTDSVKRIYEYVYDIKHGVFQWNLKRCKTESQRQFLTEQFNIEDQKDIQYYINLCTH